jgi:putative endonuclease
MYYVYILYSLKDQKLYTGFCDNLTNRVKKHKNGFVKATKYRRPIKLIYYECYLDELDAKRREKYLKGGKGKSELKIQLKELLGKLQ